MQQYFQDYEVDKYQQQWSDKMHPFCNADKQKLSLGMRVVLIFFAMFLL